MLWRLFFIVRIAVWHGFIDIASRFVRISPPLFKDRKPGYPSPFPSPDGIRRVIEKLGPSFIKLGQLLSTRDDILAPEYVSELKKLQDQVPPLPLADIREVIETELGRPIGRLFAEFNPEALAAASVAQVHEARLFTGERVAVKVIRPDIAPIVREDIRLMYSIARKFERGFETGRVLGAVNLVKEFERTIYNELDMFVEAGSIEKFESNFKEIDEIHICAVHRNLISKSVLVMEFIDGFKVDEVDAIRAHGIDTGEIAMIGLRSFSRQLMEFGFFHADPHPGNTIVMHDGRVSIIDFGLMSYLDAELMEQLANVCLGFAEHDYDMVMNALGDMGLFNVEEMDLRDFRTDLKDISEPFYGRSLDTISVKDVYDKVMQLVLKHRIRLPRTILLVLKTFVQNEAIGKKLGSRASILEVAKPFAKKLLGKSYDPRKLMKNMSRDAKVFGDYLKKMPRNVNEILEKAAGDKLTVSIQHTAAPKLHKTLEKGLNRMVVGVIIAASTIAASLVLNSSRTVMEVDLTGIGLSAVPLTAILGVTGYVIATFLGLWLIISILTSGRL